MVGNLLERVELEEKFLAVYPLITNYAARFIGKDLAEDIAQDTAIKAIKAMDMAQFTSEKQYYAWLMRVTHNRCVDVLRKRSLLQMVSLDLPPGPESDLFSAGLLETLADNSQPNPEESLICKERRQNLEAGMRHLTIDQATAVRMRYFQDFEYEQIAAGLDISYAASRTRVSRGLSSLRKVLIQGD